jgi:hypothetical protein
MHVLSETWVMSRSIQAGKSGLEPKPTSLLQPVTWVTGKEIGLRGRWRRFWRERPLLEAAAFKKETPPRRLGRVPRRGSSPARVCSLADNDFVSSQQRHHSGDD